MTRTRTTFLAAAAFLLVAGVWLNQGVGGAAWERLRDRVDDGTASAVERAWYPLAFLYRRAHDEEIYYATASALLGRPFPPAYLDRGGVPDAFAHVAPKDDGVLRVPYAEVPLEYPPTVLPFVVLPRLVASSYVAYARIFGALMAACLAAACAIAIGEARRFEEGARGATWRWALATALVLAHGAIAIQRLDALVALLFALALRAANRRRPAEVGLWIGLAAATKIVPGLLLPAVLAVDWAFYRPARRLATVAATAGAACALGLAPLVVFGGLSDVLAYHGARGLHVESPLGIVYGAARAIAGAATPATLDYGSFNFHGTVPDFLARAATPLTVALLVAVVVAVARAPSPSSDRDRAARTAAAFLAAMAALWIGGKVLSPQYLTWALPLVLALPRERMVRVATPLFGALLVGQIYFRGYYDYVYDQRALGVVTMIVRQAALFALLVLATRAARAMAAPKSSAATAAIASPAENVRGT